jgi:hypothetical protein
MSLAFGAFMVWQLYPTEGVGRAIMWGLASTVAVWVIFCSAWALTSWSGGRVVMIPATAQDWENALGAV